MRIGKQGVRQKSKAGKWPSNKGELAEQGSETGLTRLWGELDYEAGGLWTLGWFTVYTQ